MGFDGTMQVSVVQVDPLSSVDDQDTKVCKICQRMFIKKSFSQTHFLMDLVKFTSLNNQERNQDPAQVQMKMTIK